MVSAASPTPDVLKQAMKEALRETLDEQRDWIREVLIEAIEDMALLEAIREADGSDLVDRQEVIAALKDKK